MSDRDRPLNSRGEKAAAAIGGFMRSRGIAPDLVLISPAKRARETWKLVAEELAGTPKLIVDDALYDFGTGDAILSALKKRAQKAKTVLVIAHNPAVQQLAVRLIGSGDQQLIERLEHKYPTAALVQIAFEVDGWTKAKEKSGTLADFIRPRDLADNGD